LRKIAVEPVLGNLSQNLGFREFLLRGLEKVRGEYSLMCTAHNILKIAKFLRQQGARLKECLNMAELIAVQNTA
jgi:transposase